MTDRTDAIKAAISATAPSELQWMPNPGHEPSIPDGWELARVRLRNGDEAAADFWEWFWETSLGKSSITEYAIRRKPTQPTLTDLTPTDEDPAELRKRMVLDALVRPDGMNGWKLSREVADWIGEPIEDVRQTLSYLVSSGHVITDSSRPAMYRLAKPAPAAEPIRQRSGAMVISGTLTSIGTTFAAIQSGERVITLSLTTEQTRWLGQYVGGEVRLTVEVQL